MRNAYRKRLVHCAPRIMQFKPAGFRSRYLETISLSIDEYEAIRLADFEGLDHNAAAEKMDISRPTFSRLIEKARNKIAQAIVKGMVLQIEGGNFNFATQTYYCRDCGIFTEQPLESELDTCPHCNSKNIIDLNQHHHQGHWHHFRGRGNR